MPTKLLLVAILVLAGGPCFTPASEPAPGTEIDPKTGYDSISRAYEVMMMEGDPEKARGMFKAELEARAELLSDYERAMNGYLEALARTRPDDVVGEVKALSEKAFRPRFQALIIVATILRAHGRDDDAAEVEEIGRTLWGE